MSELREQGVNPQFEAYLKQFLKSRHCQYLQEVKCGVPQGDPLSMLLFCLGTECILRTLTAENIDFVCYADDIVIDIGTT